MSKPFQTVIHSTSRNNSKIYRQCLELIQKSLANEKLNIEITFCEWDEISNYRDAIKLLDEIRQILLDRDEKRDKRIIEKIEEVTSLVRGGR